MIDQDYRPVSRFAVAGLFFIPFTTFGFALPITVFAGVPAFLCAVVALYEIRKYQLAGRQLAMWSMVLSVVAITAIPACVHWRYASENLPGYHRVHFGQLARNKQIESVIDTDVCLKGFHDVNRWSPDNPERTIRLTPSGDRDGIEPAVLVEWPSDVDWRISAGALAVYGRLIHNPGWTEGSHVPRYVMRNAKVRKSKTGFDIGTRSGGC